MRWLIPLLLLSTAVPQAQAKADTIDPAVVHANATQAGGIGYRQGWYGSGDNRIHYVETGRGPLVILYHGFPSFWYSWFDQMEVLKTRYRVVAVDAPGANLSAKPNDLDRFRVAALAKQLDGLARHLAGKKRFTLVGHDWGAALAYAYAQAYPHRLNGVVGISAPPYNLFLSLAQNDAEQQARSGYMQSFRSLTLAEIEARGIATRIYESGYGKLIKSGAISEKEADLFRAAVANPTAINGGMNWYRANIPPFAVISDAHYWPEKQLRLNMPTLLIWGNDDRTFVPAFIDHFAKDVPHAEIKRIDGVNHWATMEADATTTATLAAFVDRVNR
jgi:pimeloyl-ACP methyl ester carboxylesterase